MRESSVFGQRTQSASEKEPVKKYFLVFEGQKTEFMYFKAVSDMRSEVGINPLIELIHIKRSYGELGWSNPKKILDRLCNDLDESRNGCISYIRLFNKVMDYFIDNGIVSNNAGLFKCVRYEYDKFRCSEYGVPEYSDVVDIEYTCCALLSIINCTYDLKNVIENFSEILSAGEFTYDSTVDEMCIIVDRDSKSFVSHNGNDQYQYVLEECNKKKFSLYVTNPCFEFWLLLHLIGSESINIEMMLDNPLVEGNRTYAENELRKILPEYSKSNYDARYFISKIDCAIANAKCFCEEASSLKVELGSNLGCLIERMRQ